MTISGKTRQKINYIFIYITLAVIVVFFVFPIAWELITSFKPIADVYSPTIRFSPSLKSWNQLIRSKNIIHCGKNSVIVVVGTTVITMVVGSLAGYSLGRLKIKGRENLSFWFLTMRMMPPIAIVIPFYLIMSKLNLLNTYWVLILAYTTFNLPLAVWLLKGFFQEIPFELEEAALIDGCTVMGTFWRIVLPLSSPGLIATAILCVIFSWNEFLFALILTGLETHTLPIAAASVSTHFRVDWGFLSVVVIIVVVPVVVFGLAIQKYLIRGLSFGALKG